MMKFNIYSNYFTSDYTEWSEVMKRCLMPFKHSEIKQNYCEIELESLEDLKNLSQKLNEEYEKHLTDNHGCFQPKRLIVDFEEMEICIYDYYNE